MNLPPPGRKVSKLLFNYRLLILTNWTRPHLSALPACRLPDLLIVPARLLLPHHAAVPPIVLPHPGANMQPAGEDPKEHQSITYRYTLPINHHNYL